RTPWLLFVWFFTEVGTIVTSATYAIIWWSGDIFNEQLTMSIAEFGLAMVNCPCFVIVLLYYLRITGKLTSMKLRPPDPMLAHRFSDPKVPEWRESMRERPSEHLLRKLKRQERRRISAAWDAYERAQRERQSAVLPHWSPDYRNPTPYIPTPDYSSSTPQPTREHVSRLDYRPGPPGQRRYSSPDKATVRRSRSKSPTARRVYSKKQHEHYTNV
uniref:G_PROTEIN_RECEP_F1_2 domain-containing protein n=1 Tax=Steinernema glaseri TaxID=37863 RepID=A0A1I8AIX6_9BILA